MEWQGAAIAISCIQSLLCCSGTLAASYGQTAYCSQKLQTDRPDGKMIRRVLALGIPSGIENSMFQLGKLAIQSSVSTLGTGIAIAAQAMTNILENLNGIAAIGVGIGLMTVVGQCLGAGRKDEAVYYIREIKCSCRNHCCVQAVLLVFALTIPITKLGGWNRKAHENVFS